MASGYDLIVIGSGPSGQSAAELAAFLGHSVLVVEQTSPGGTVTTSGGVPTKTLREVALDLAHLSAASPAGSWSGSERLQALRTRTLAVCDTLQRTIAQQLEERGVQYVRGTARLTRGRLVVIDGADGSRREARARAIVIATGSKPARFAGVPFEDPDVYDSHEIFRMRQLPASVAIAGGGPVGVEFATVFTALGVPVTLVDSSDRLLPTMDSELTRRLAEDLTARGVTLVSGARVNGVARRGDTLDVALSSGESFSAAAILFATGRTSNVDGLGLDAAGVHLDDRGRVIVDRYFRTTCEGVYAVGDVVAPTLASVATQQGRVAVCHAFGLAFGVHIDRAPGSAVYGMPEIAGVGLTEDDARGRGLACVVGRCDLATTARGAIAGRGGVLKLIVNADDRRLLGVHCIGDIASELVGMGHAVLHMAGAIDVFLTLALNTPTYQSAYRDAAINAIRQLAAFSGITRAGERPSAPSSMLQTTGALS